VVTKNPIARGPNLRAKFLENGGTLKAGEHVDHILELQLGGGNGESNLQGLDGSMNSSFGSQIRYQIKNLPNGTAVNGVIYLPDKIEKN
jgi:hypothetical protein